ncbi:MAG: thiamine phosphate synthase [Verrucomicrobiota bacterium]
MNQDQRRATLAHACLYGIVDFGYVAPGAVVEITQQLLTGGADVIQLRAKGAEMAQIIHAAKQILPLCKTAGIPFILNDFPELAVELGADGVHIGQDDGSIYDVRRSIGEDMLIGRSTHSLEQARNAMDDGADYIGFGPLFPTPTKAGRPAIGLEEVSKMETEVGQFVPAFCIGGIKMENLPQVLEAGAKRCVIVSQLLTAVDVTKATAEVKRALS